MIGCIPTIFNICNLQIIHYGLDSVKAIDLDRFTILLGYTFKESSQVNSDDMGVNVDDEYINNLRAVDDIVLISNRKDHVVEMLKYLHQK